MHSDNHGRIWRRKDLLNAEQRTLQKKVLAYLGRVAEDTGISQGLLGSRQDVANLVCGNREVSLMRGWRAKLLGSELEALLSAG